MNYRQYFVLALFPRVLLAIIFSSIGYLGDGGDPEIYHLFGVYLKDILVNPNEASFEAVIDRHGYANDEKWQDKYYAIYEVVSAGEFRTWINTTLPIISIHALLYSISEMPFLVVLASSIFSSFANAKFAVTYGLSKKQYLWLALNPVSIFFSATHYKEIWVESFLLISLVFIKKRKLYGVALSFLGLILFRMTYAPLVIFIVLLMVIKKVDVKIWILSIFLVLLLAPPFWWFAVPEDASSSLVYSLVHMNDLTRKLLSPLVGMIQPFPFLAAPLNSIFGWFLVIYGLFHLYLLVVTLLAATFHQCRNFYVIVALISSIVLSYYVLGGAAAKARFYAPLMPLLIMAYITVRISVGKLVCDVRINCPSSNKYKHNKNI